MKSISKQVSFQIFTSKSLERHTCSILMEVDGGLEGDIGVWGRNALSSRQIDI